MIMSPDSLMSILSRTEALRLGTLEGLFSPSSSDDEKDRMLEFCRLLFENADSLVLVVPNDDSLCTENELGELNRCEEVLAYSCRETLGSGTY